MKNIIGSILLVTLVLSCAKQPFQAERVEIVIDGFSEGGSELYFVKNTPDSVAPRRKLFFEFTKKNMIDLCTLDSSILCYSIDFFRDCSSTRRYLESRKRRFVDIYQENEDYSQDGFLYRRSKKNLNVWYLVYPHELKDTIYCDCVPEKAIKNKFWIKRENDKPN